MKQCIKLMTLFIIIVLILTACSIPYPTPENGQFYCEDLQMTLDFTTHKATFIDENGIEQTKHFSLGYDPSLCVEYIEYDNGEAILHTILFGDFKYRNGNVIIKTNDGGNYLFLPLED